MSRALPAMVDQMIQDFPTASEVQKARIVKLFAESALVKEQAEEHLGLKRPDATQDNPILKALGNADIVVLRNLPEAQKRKLLLAYLDGNSEAMRNVTEETVVADA